MDTYRAFLAIIISFVILLGYQYLFVGFDKPPIPAETSAPKSAETVVAQSAPATAEPPSPQPELQAAPKPVVASRAAKDITVDQANSTHSRFSLE